MRTLVLALLLIASPARADIYLLRHAETAAGHAADPPLSARGETRAANVARLLHGLGVSAVFTTDYARTWGTGRPIARAAGVSITLYDPDDKDALVGQLNASAGHHVVVGHSNTVPDLVRALGGVPGAPIEHGEYDRLYRLRVSDAGIETQLLRTSARPATANRDD